MSHDVLNQQIRFALSQLGERNRHHDFEEMCEKIAQRRFSADARLATGPVSGGGDQGRDIEAHASADRLASPPDDATPHVRSPHHLVFACTVRKKDLPGKVRADLTSIVAGKTVQRVVFFCTENVSAKKTHDLQQEARDNHSVDLEIVDQGVLASWLTHDDLFWIAVEHLGIPEHLRPVEGLRVLDGWYEEQLIALRASDAEELTNTQRFIDVKKSARHALTVEEARPDLPEWVAALEAAADACPEWLTTLEFRFRYEQVWCQAIGTRCLPAAAVERCVDLAVERQDPHQIADALALLTLATGAWARRLPGAPTDKLRSWRRRLEGANEGLIASADPLSQPNHLLHLLETRLRFAMLPELEEDQRPEAGTLSEMRGDRETLDRMRSEVKEEDWLPYLGSSHALMACLGQMVDLLPHATTYPVEQLADYLDLLTRKLISELGFYDISDAVDAKLSAVDGAVRLGERARVRALTHTQRGELLLCVRELEKALRHFWDAGQMGSVVQIGLFLSGTYLRLGLPTAAKHYALGCATLLDHHPTLDGELVVRALAAAARASAAAGCWADAEGFHGLADNAVTVLVGAPVVDPVTVEAEIARSWRHRQTRLQAPGLVPLLEDLSGYDSLGDEGVEPGSDFDTLLATPESPSEYPVREEAFCDFGELRRYRLRVSDADWTVECANDPAVVLATERLLSALELTLCELARMDPCWLSVPIQLHAVLTEETTQDPLARDDLGRPRGLRILPGSGDVPQQRDLLAVCALVEHVSALSTPQLEPLLDEALANVVPKLALGRPYTDHDMHLPAEHYATLAAVDPSELPHVQSKTQAALATASTDPGPGYSLERDEEFVRNRYARVAERLPKTLRLLRGDTAALTTIERLRGEGWKDWHLLLSILTLFTSKLDPDEVLAGTRACREQGGTEFLAPGEITEDALRHAFTMAGLAVSKTWNLNVAGVRSDAVLELLRRRYAFGDTDVDHDDPFQRQTVTPAGPRRPQRAQPKRSSRAQRGGS